MILPEANGIACPPAANTLWAEIAPCEHLVQFYQDDGVFLDSLEGFAAGGLEAGDGVVVIATPSHLASLGRRLSKRGISLKIACSREQYIPLDAEETLGRFMVNGWPDEELLETLVRGVLDRARGRDRRIRAFGEMVALMWARGLNGATVRLEQLWHRFCQREAFSLFCAYPRCGFTQDTDASMKEICEAHSRVIA